MRKCGSSEVKAECKKGVEKYGYKGELCYCDKQLCNESTVLRVSMATGLIMIVSVVLSIL